MPNPPSPAKRRLIVKDDYSFVQNFLDDDYPKFNDLLKYDSVYDPDDDWTVACLGSDSEYVEKLVEDGSSIQVSHETYSKRYQSLQ